MFGTKLCPICFNGFHPHNGNQKYCKFCHEHRRDDIKEYQAKMHEKKEREKRHKLNPIWSITREIKEYNKKHGTYLSYGQYVMKKSLGQLKD
jgi:hypothetical protein